MAQGRMLRKNISESKKFAELSSDKARLLYLMMLPHVDVEGRLKADPHLVSGRIIPRFNWSKDIIRKCLDSLHEVGLIILYETDDDLFLEFTRFGCFQKLRKDRESESIIPPPDGKNAVSTETPQNDGKVADFCGALSRELFEQARLKYPGGTLGFGTEWKNFIRKHKDWKNELPKILPAIEQQISWRENANGEFRPPWKHFKTWLNQRNWEMEINAPAEKGPNIGADGKTVRQRLLDEREKAKET